MLIVGPEGGISPAERAALRDAGAIEARLGPTVLRTSTAGAVGAADPAHPDRPLVAGLPGAR